MKITSKTLGFTLVELVMVIILIGVLSALGIGLFTRSSAFSPLLATQQLQSATLLAQQAALAGKYKPFLEIKDETFWAQYEKKENDELCTEEDNDGDCIIQSFSLNGEDFSVNPSSKTIHFNKLAVPVNVDGEAIGATRIEISKDGTQFVLCISSLGAVYQVNSVEACDE